MRNFPDSKSRGGITSRVVLRLDIPTTSTTEQYVSATPATPAPLSDVGYPSPAESWDSLYADSNSEYSPSPLDPYLGASPAKSSLEQIQRFFGGYARPPSSWSATSSESGRSWYTFSSWKSRSSKPAVTVEVTKAKPYLKGTLVTDVSSGYLDEYCMPYVDVECEYQGKGIDMSLGSSCEQIQPYTMGKNRKQRKFTSPGRRRTAPWEISILR